MTTLFTVDLKVSFLSYFSFRSSKSSKKVRYRHIPDEVLSMKRNTGKALNHISDVL